MAAGNLALLLMLVAGAAGLRSGAGIADVTGPVTEIPFMGYAFPNQTGEGLHFRLYARAFVFVDDAGNRFAYVSADICMGFYGIKMKVIEGLKAVFGDLYDHHNVMLSGTHTHSGPGALSWFLLYDISMLGRDKKHFDAVVQGVVLSIVRAHNNLSPTTIDVFMQQGMLYNASSNRSPSSYLANPQAERDFYARWGGDTDKNMTVLHLRNASGPIGAVAFFAVHGTSMHNSNRLVSGDNKGHAASIFERSINGNNTLGGRGPFVAAFGQSNEGDVTPNILGAWCYGRVGGIYCNDNRSLCGGKNEHCVSVGPAGFDDDYNSCRMIGERQSARAQALFASAPQQGLKIEGAVATAFKWVNMSNVTVSALYTSTGETGHTCRPAVGDSFAAGTTDGPGAFNFYQGERVCVCVSDVCLFFPELPSSLCVGSLS
jgi:neutral ceramidase